MKTGGILVCLTKLVFCSEKKGSHRNVKSVEEVADFKDEARTGLEEVTTERF